MDLDSDNFSDVDELSDISRDVLQVKSSFVYELDRCIQFVSVNQKIKSLPEVPNSFKIQSSIIVSS